MLCGGANTVPKFRKTILQHVMDAERYRAYLDEVKSEVKDRRKVKRIMRKYRRDKGFSL